MALNAPLRLKGETLGRTACCSLLLALRAICTRCAIAYVLLGLSVVYICCGRDARLLFVDFSVDFPCENLQVESQSDISTLA